MKEGCSTFVSNIRHQMAMLCGLPSHYFTVQNAERRQSPEVARYLKFDLDKAVYLDLPPVIFLNLHYDVKTMFQNDILIKVCHLHIVYSSVC